MYEDLGHEHPGHTASSSWYPGLSAPTAFGLANTLRVRHFFAHTFFISFIINPFVFRFVYVKHFFRIAQIFIHKKMFVNFVQKNRPPPKPKTNPSTHPPPRSPTPAKPMKSRMLRIHFVEVVEAAGHHLCNFLLARFRKCPHRLHRSPHRSRQVVLGYRKDVLQQVWYRLKIRLLTLKKSSIKAMSTHLSLHPKQKATSATPASKATPAESLL